MRAMFSPVIDTRATRHEMELSASPCRSFEHRMSREQRHIPRVDDVKPTSYENTSFLSQSIRPTKNDVEAGEVMRVPADSHNLLSIHDSTKEVGNQRLFALRVKQAVHMHYKITHMGVIHSLLRL